MKNAQAFQLSCDISAMQATVLMTLRQLNTESETNDGDQRLYARWYCRRAIAQELGARSFPAQGASVREDPRPQAHGGASAPVPADPAHSWADQVQTYLLRKRSNALVSAPLE